MPEIARLTEYIAAVEALLDRTGSERELLAGVRAAKKALVSRDDWLPAAMAVAHPLHFQQYLLHRDVRGRFAVVSFVWGPGQGTPVHDHTVWGVIGMLRGGEVCEPFRREGSAIVPDGPAVRLAPGDVEAVSPDIGDIHRVSNAFADRVSISIHTYGADIGFVPRHAYDVATGEAKEFMSGYANA